MSSTIAAPERRLDARAGKYLTFFLDEEEYGLEILKVQEIIGMLPVTRVPRTASYVRGVINLRGRVIPIVDLRVKFGMPEWAGDDTTCMIVVQVQGIQLGIVVDRVSEVLAILEEEIDDAPAFGASVNTEFLLGIAKSAGKIKLLLDIDRVLSTDDVIDIRTVADAAIG